MLGVVLGLAIAAGGCSSGNWVVLRQMPQSPLSAQLNLFTPEGPRPTERTLLLLRRYALEDDLKGNLDPLLIKLREIVNREPSSDKLYSLAELAYLGGKHEEANNQRRALELYSCSLMHSYLYLFDDRLGKLHNPYDPEFRGACDLYNGALESALRIVKKQGGLQPGATQTIESANQSMDIQIVLRGWQGEEFEKFDFVSDYEITGLRNQYHTYGLGVPLIAVRKGHATSAAVEHYYPPGLSFPVTAFLRVLSDPHRGGAHHTAILELHDPTSSLDTIIAGRPVPLESDLSTPLAYCLSQPELRNLDVSTLGFLHPDQTQKAKGLYMLEPYRPGKIPVLMVHGIWSSPITWMEMFNDLRSSPEIRDRYQFWFYLYPSGQPFWYSAAQLREDLAQMRQVIDPGHREPALDQMVLVGHSMGGLISKMQTIDSGGDFWNLICSQPLQEVNGSQEVLGSLENTFFFHPNPSIRRVITIGTPHRGSKLSNSTTQWLSDKLITLPKLVISEQEQLRLKNPGVFPKASLIGVSTSIDSLSPKSPILPLLLTANRPPWVKYHNIVGRIPDEGLVGKVAGGSDGVVAFESAHLDNADSEIIVNSEHTQLHRHPRSVLEVRRILLEHLAELNAFPRSQPERLPRTASAGNNPAAPESSAAAVTRR